MLKDCNLCYNIESVTSDNNVRDSKAIEFYQNQGPSIQLVPDS